MIELKVGGKYLTRHGSVVEIKRIETYHGGATQHYGISDDEKIRSPSWYTGGFYMSATSVHDWDLIKELEGDDVDMAKFTKQFGMVFRKSPTEKFCIEHFDKKDDLYKRYKDVLRKSSAFRIFQKQADGTYKTIYTKNTFVDILVKELTKVITESGKGQEVYLALRKANEHIAEKLNIKR